MAKSQDVNKDEEVGTEESSGIVKVRALMNIKYGDKVVKEGKFVKIDAADVEDLVNRGIVQTRPSK